MIRLAIVSSTAGSVMHAVLGIEFMRQRIATLVTDRECGAATTAEEFGIPVVRIPTDDPGVFSDELDRYLSDDPHDLIISFYTRLFTGRLLEHQRCRLVNCHPSILPACPGMRGFEDTVAARSLYVGATVHFIDDGVDTGAPIVQAAIPFNPELPLADNRHAVFVAQCRMLIQVVCWFEDNRVGVDKNGRAVIAGARYEEHNFSPNLDSHHARIFSIKQPTSGQASSDRES